MKTRCVVARPVVENAMGKTNDHFDKVELAADLEVDLRTVSE